MNIVGAFISIDALEIQHVPYDVVFVRNAVRTMQIPSDSRDIERLAAIIPLEQ